MEIRDNRDKQWFWLDNEYLNGYAKYLGPTASLVYISLCRHVDNSTQKCFPSMELIAEELGMQRAAISRAIKSLEDWKIIELEENYDKKNKRRKNNIYTLTKKTEWKEKPCNNTLHGNEESHVTLKSEPCNPDDESHVTQSYSNYTHTNKTHKNNTLSDETSQNLNKQVSEVIECFNLVNDNYTKWYANTTQRKAVKELIEKYDLRRVLKAVYLASFCYRDKFFPNFTTPYELVQKWAKVMKYFKVKLPDKRFVEDFEKYIVSMEKQKSTGGKPEKIEIGGLSFNYEVTE